MGWLDFLLSRDGDDGSPEAKEAPTGASSGRSSEIVASLREHLATVARAHGRKAEPKDYDADVGIYDAGYIDSLSVSEFLLLVEKQYGVNVPDWLVADQARSLNKLGAYVEAELAKK